MWGEGEAEWSREGGKGRVVAGRRGGVRVSGDG